MEKKNLFWQTYLALEEEVLNVSRYIFFTDEKGHQLETYSPVLADLLVRCCIEIESISKELYYKNKNEEINNKPYFDKDCIKKLNEKWHICEKEIKVICPNFYFHKKENIVLQPLLKAEKGTAFFLKNYQSVKHNRYEELKKANVKSVIHALAALYLLNLYNLNIKKILGFNDVKNYDLTFGSKIFAIQEPSEDNVLKVINCNLDSLQLKSSNNSPYILKLTDYYYEQHEQIMKKQQDMSNKFWKMQPELHDEEFLKIYDSKDFVMKSLYKLFSYRLDKKLSNCATYDEKKEKLLKSEEYINAIQDCSSKIFNQEITSENFEKIKAETINACVLKVVREIYIQNIGVLNEKNNCEMVLDTGDVSYNVCVK